MDFDPRIGEFVLLMIGFNDYRGNITTFQSYKNGDCDMSKWPNTKATQDFMNKSYLKCMNETAVVQGSELSEELVLPILLFRSCYTLSFWLGDGKADCAGKEETRAYFEENRPNL